MGRLVQGRRVRLAAWVALAALGLNYLLAAVDFGAPAFEEAFTSLTYQLLVSGAAIACIAGAFRSRQGRWGWALIGIGLGAWALGEIGFSVFADSTAEIYPWATNGLFLVFYACSLAGIFALTIRRGRRPRASLSLAVSLLGLATLWSWLVFSAVELGDPGPEVAATLAYPLLDLALLVSAVVGLATNRLRVDPPLVALTVGFGIIGLADVLYAVQVESATYTANTLLDSLWPTGALMVGIAPWLAERGFRAQRSQGDLLPAALAVGSASIALGLLVLDHFERVAIPTLVLAGATGVAAIAQLVVLHLQRYHATAAARVSATRAVSALAAAVDAKDHHTSNHSERVSEYASRFAAALQLDSDCIDRLRVAGQLHDVGKIAVPDEILLKPRRLTDYEFDRIKEHSAEGERIVRAVGLGEEARWIRHLHERWDGGGYPDGLREEEIPFESRLLAIADALDAVTTDRAYRARLTVAEAQAELLRGSGSQFDPVAVAQMASFLGRSGLDPAGWAPRRPPEIETTQSPTVGPPDRLEAPEEVQEVGRS